MRVLNSAEIFDCGVDVWTRFFLLKWTGNVEQLVGLLRKDEFLLANHRRKSKIANYFLNLWHYDLSKLNIGFFVSFSYCLWVFFLVMSQLFLKIDWFLHKWQVNFFTWTLVFMCALFKMGICIYIHFVSKHNKLYVPFKDFKTYVWLLSLR